MPQEDIETLQELAAEILAEEEEEVDVEETEEGEVVPAQERDRLGAPSVYGAPKCQ